MSSNGILTPSPTTKTPPKLESPIPKTLFHPSPVLEVFIPSLPIRGPLINPLSTRGKKKMKKIHKNTNLLQKLIIQHNYQQMKKKQKTNEIKQN